MKKIFSLFAAVLLAGSMMAETYTKTAYASLKTGDEVIITEQNASGVFAASNDKGTSAAPVATAVTVANDIITTTATDIIWTVEKDGDNISFKTGDNYLYCTNTNNGVRVGSNANKVFSIEATSGYLYNNATSRYIGVYNSQDWRCYTSVNSNITNQTLAFYVKGEGGEVTPVTPDPEPADAVVYNWNTVGTTILGTSGVEASTVKIRNNADAVDAIKCSSSYVYAEGKWVAIKPAEGKFLAGDTVFVAGVISNDATDGSKYAMVDAYAADGATRLFRGDTVVNGKKSADEPVVEAFVLAADQDSLLFGRYGNTNLFITTLQVVRPAAAPAPAVVANFCQTEVGHFMAENADPNSYVLLSVGTKNGKTIVRIDQDAAKNSQMFDYLQVTGITATGEDVAEGGAAAMAVEFDTPALVNDSLTLEILWSTVNWPGRWMVQNIRVAAAECEHAVVPVIPVSCADIYSKAANDEVLLNDVTVTYVNGANVYVKDAAGSMLIYLPNGTTVDWVAGDVISGLEGVVAIYKNLYEVKPSAAQLAAVTVNHGEAPAPVELTAVPVAADMNKYVIIKGVKCEAAFGSNKNMTATLGEATFILRNNFNANIAFDTEKTYTIVGVVAVFNNDVQIYFISAEEEVEPIVPADRRINAYGLNVVANGDNYVFSYYSNIAGTAARIIFYDNGQRVAWEEIDAPVAGVNDATIAKDRIPAGTNLTWAVELKANPVTEFGKVFDDTENVLARAHAVIDNSPESDYMGRIYVENRAGSKAGGLYVYNADYTINTANTKCGLEVFRSAGRPAVAADGTLWMADWGDGGADAGFGIASVDPATLTATKFFNGTQNADGLWTNGDGVEMGSSCAGVGLYGEGADMKLYAMNEDGAVLPAHGCVIYNIGQADGTILKTWNQAPSAMWTLSDNAAQNLEVTPCSHGVFFSCNRSEGQNTAGARALQLVNEGSQIFVGTPGEGGTMPELTGCAGGGFALSRDENHAYIVNGAGNILSYDVAWSGDVPTMTYVETFETTFAAIGTMKLDYAGNIIASAGTGYGSNMRLVVYGVPTDNNVVVVPAKKSLTVSGTATAINDFFEEVVVEKVIRNGQVLIIRDGKTYNMMGQQVR